MAKQSRSRLSVHFRVQVQTFGRCQTAEFGVQIVERAPRGRVVALCEKIPHDLQLRIPPGD